MLLALQEAFVRLLDATNDLTPAEPLPIIAPRRIDHFYTR
jgi:hypothetical protein